LCFDSVGQVIGRFVQIPTQRASNSGTRSEKVHWTPLLTWRNWGQL